MTLPNLRRGTHTAESDDNATECTQFMLAEIENIRKDLKIFMQRFENLLTFYLTALAAVLSAIVVVITQLQPSLAQRVSLALLGVGAYGFSMVIYIRLGITRALMVRLITQERRSQEYFLQRHSHLRKYASAILTIDSNDWSKWQRIIFTRQTVLLFYLLATFISVLAAATSVAVVIAVLDCFALPLWQFPGFHLALYLGVGAGAAGFTTLICLLTLRWQRTQARRYAMWSLGDPLGVRNEIEGSR